MPLLALMLLLVVTVEAQQPSELVVYFYRDGQAVPITRPAFLAESHQDRAEQLLLTLLAGPNPKEEAVGLSSPLPAGTALLAVAVSGERSRKAAKRLQL